MIVYKATNKINGKSYIGSTSKDLEVRKRQHRSEAMKGTKDRIFHRAIRKHGFDSFEWTILDDTSTNVGDLRNLEAHYIAELKTFGMGYNATPGYDNTTLGYKFTDEQKNHLRLVRKDKPNPNLGNTWSEEQRQSASIRCKENHKHLTGDANPSNRPEVKAKISDALMGPGNGMSKQWYIKQPDGKEIILIGGLKRFLKDNGLTYSAVTPMLKGLKDEYKGWIIRHDRDKR